MTETKASVQCFHCKGKGYYWKQPLPKYLIPSGNYERLGNEIKRECYICKGKGVINNKNPWFDAVMKAMKDEKCSKTT